VVIFRKNCIFAGGDFFVGLIIQVIYLLAQLVSLLIIIHIVLSYFMSPYHPIRQTIDGFIEPRLAPIRRIGPPVVMIDFSPMVLMILIQLVARLLASLLASI